MKTGEKTKHFKKLTVKSKTPTATKFLHKQNAKIHKCTHISKQSKQQQQRLQGMKRTHIFWIWWHFMCVCVLVKEWTKRSHTVQLLADKPQKSEWKARSNTLKTESAAVLSFRFLDKWATTFNRFSFSDAILRI